MKNKKDLILAQKIKENLMKYVREKRVFSLLQTDVENVIDFLIVELAELKNELNILKGRK